MEQNEENDKKTKILIIICLIVLTALVSTMTFAMFTFTGTGSQENVLTTGNVSVDYEESSVIDLSNQYPMVDSEGIKQSGTGNEIKFTVIGNLNSSNLTINYAIGLEVLEEGTSLKENYIKVYLLKGDSVVGTFTNGVGRLISEIKPYKVNGVMDNYVMYVDSFATEGTTNQEYTLKAWVSDTYDLPKTITDGTDSHSEYTTSEIFKFKIKVVATDTAMAIVNTGE